MFREEAGRLTATLVRLLGDFDLAEESVAEAVTEALDRWPDQGVPEAPGAWLLTTARNKALDRIRRDRRYQDKLAVVAALPQSAEREPDDQLRLIFTCCHPAINREAQIAHLARRGRAHHRRDRPCVRCAGGHPHQAPHAGQAEDRHRRFCSWRRRGATSSMSHGLKALFNDIGWKSRSRAFHSVSSGT